MLDGEDWCIAYRHRAIFQISIVEHLKRVEDQVMRVPGVPREVAAPRLRANAYAALKASHSCSLNGLLGARLRKYADVLTDQYF
eukprot:9022530-Pyramimonas_sp.AAC.1